MEVEVAAVGRQEEKREGLPRTVDRHLEDRGQGRGRRMGKGQGRVQDRDLAASLGRGLAQDQGHGPVHEPGLDPVDGPGLSLGHDLSLGRGLGRGNRDLDPSPGHLRDRLGAGLGRGQDHRPDQRGLSRGALRGPGRGPQPNLIRTFPLDVNMYGRVIIASHGGSRTVGAHVG